SEDPLTHNDCYTSAGTRKDNRKLWRAVPGQKVRVGPSSDIWSALLRQGQGENFQVLPRNPLHELRSGVADHVLRPVPGRGDAAGHDRFRVHVLELGAESRDNGGEVARERVMGLGHVTPRDG